MESSTDMTSSRTGEDARRRVPPGGGNAATESGDVPTASGPGGATTARGAGAPGPGDTAAGWGGAAARHAAPRPQGAYTAAVVDGTSAFTAGMTPRVDGALVVRGRVGAELDLPAARRAAGLAARNAVTALVAALGDASRLRRFLRMTVYVACADDFHELSAVADGATDGLLAAHADLVAGQGPEPADPDRRAPAVPLPVRSAVGVRTLPQNAPVEVELTAAVRAEP